ncbi:MAG: hemerythrin domain-containing protein [Anaerolineae bacterium]|nr:hemerythrin domain-containing protein [Anaerolineae bacterium]
MLADQFTQVFREEHRKVRDVLFDLIHAFKNRDKPSIQLLLHKMVMCAGPHFRYEEEAMYPELVEIFGEEYVQKLLEDHDRAIGTTKRLIEITQKNEFTDEETVETIRLTRTILPHVSDCDGLSIMVESLPSQVVQHILDCRDASLSEGVDLMLWASTIRNRPIIMPG